MPFFFFTDPTDLGPQPGQGSFGRQNSTLYQMSKRCRSRRDDVNPLAFAVTNGRIAVVEADTNNNTYANSFLTIILQPDTQPGGNIPNVKYYIYKGIIRSSLILDSVVDAVNGDDRALLDMSQAGNYPFLNRVQTSYNDYVNNLPVGAPAPDPINEDWLGLSRTNGFATGASAAVNTLDEIFNNNWGPNTPPLPYVREGEAIGAFINRNFNVGSGGDGSGVFAFEIVLDGVGHNPPFLAAAGSSNDTGDTWGSNFRRLNIGTGAVAGNATFNDNDAYNRNVRSEILHYMDPCAFYGAFANPGMPDLAVRNGAATTTFTQVGVGVGAKANNIYSQLLDLPGYDTDATTPNPTGKIFENRNVVYIDIRDRFNCPYDWTRDKTLGDEDADIWTDVNLRLGFNGSGTLVKEIDYHGEESSPFSHSKDWPILAIKLDDSGATPMQGFPTGQANGGIVNTIDLQFPNPHHVDGSACLFVLNGNVVTPRPTIGGGVDGFIGLDDVFGDWADPIALDSPNYNVNAMDAVPIANYIKIWHLYFYTDFYEGTIADQNAVTGFGRGYSGLNHNKDYPQPIERHPQNYCDFLWPIDTTLNWTNWPETRIRSTIYSVHSHVDNVAVSGYDFMGHIGIARDANGPSPTDPMFVPKVTLFAYNTIPRNSSIGMLDRSFNESALYPFSDNPSYLQNIGDNSKDYRYATRAVTLNDGTVVQVDQMLKRDIEELQAAAAATGAAVGDLPGINVDDFVYFTINKADYDQILIDWQTFIAGSVTDNPIKAWWSFEPLESGWDNTAEREYVRYQINIKYLNKSNGSGVPLNQPAKMETFTTIYETVKLMDKHDLSTRAIPADGRGFCITDIGGIDRIDCTINFVKGPSLTQQEFLSYRDYALKNINQIWSNPEGQPLDPFGSGNPVDPDMVNSGLTARVRSRGNNRQYPITAWGVSAQQGSAKSFRELRDKEIMFLVERSRFANMPNQIQDDRSAINAFPVDIRDAAGTVVDQRLSARQGRLVFTQPAGVVNAGNPYSDFNVAAHEFGHILGLTDRYTYKAEVDGNNCIVPGSGDGVNLYLPITFDPDYGEDYRWVMNLMSVGAFKVPTTPLQDGFQNFPAEFLNAINGYESSNNNRNSTGCGGNTFITPTQWELIRAYALDDRDFESNRFRRPQFDLQTYAFFVPQGSVFDLGEFAGYDAALGRAVSDHDFNDVAGTHIMANRINDSVTGGAGVPSSVLGYFDPFQGPTDPLITRSSANSNSEMFNIRMGNSIQNVLFRSTLTSFGGASSNHPNAGDPAILVSGNPTLFNAATASHNLLNGAGDSDPANFGRNVWNKVTTTGLNRVEVFPYPNSTGQEISHTFIYLSAYDNRDELISLIVNGGF